MILNMQPEDEKLVQDFLAWFRTQRQDPHPRHDVVRWLVGGSANLSGTLDALDCVDRINDFVSIELPVLTDSQVRFFVEEMLSSRDVQFDAGVPQAVNDALGRPIPLFMQMATQDLHRLWKTEQRPLTSDDVDAVFAGLITKSSAQEKLQHYYSRIREYYREPSRSAAYELLSKLSLTDDGLAIPTLRQELDYVLAEAGIEPPKHERKQLFNRLMLDLENDFYITATGTEDDERYDFASGILKLWWRKYYA